VYSALGITSSQTQNQHDRHLDPADAQPYGRGEHLAERPAATTHPHHQALTGPDGLLRLRDDRLAQIVEFCRVDTHHRAVRAERHSRQLPGPNPVADRLRIDAQTARDLGHGQPI
jgi:hypothetical protein